MKLILFIFLVYNCYTEIKADIDWAAIDSKVNSYLTRNRVPGLALSIVNSTSNVELYGKGYGLMDIETNSPTTNKTLFFIASISKSFTAAVTSRFLSERFPNLGRNVLDTPISVLSPQYNLTLIDRYRSEHVTFRDLLSHRVCVGSSGFGAPSGVYKSRSEIIYRMRYMPEICGYRSGFQYSNQMFILAGDIVSHIAGVPFESLVQDLLDDLGMTDTLIVNNSDDYEQIPNMSRGYYLREDGVLTKMNASTYNTHFGAAAGGIISTAEDMGKYLAFHLTKGNINKEHVLSEDVIEWLYETSNHMDFKGRNPEDPNESVLYRNYGYGLGLNLGVTRDGYREIGHGGDLSPFTSQLTFLPAFGYGLFIGTNGPGNPPILDGYLQLQDEIFDILRGTTNQDYETKLPMTHEDTKTKLPQPEVNIKSVHQRIDPESLVGTFGHPVEGDIQILWNGTNLLLEYGNFGEGYLTEVEAESNVYQLTLTGELLSMLLASTGGYPPPDIFITFDEPDTLEYQFLSTKIRYNRDAMIETYPEIPWEQGSC